MKLNSAEIREIRGKPDLEMPRRKMKWNLRKAVWNLMVAIATVFVVAELANILLLWWTGAPW